MAVLSSNLRLVSFNMHGYNQGIDAVSEITDTLSPDCIALQEHWLTSEVSSKLDGISSYSCIFSPALRRATEIGPIFGRPSGGLAILVHERLVKFCKTIVCSDRYICISIGSLLLVNVYLPCVGTPDRYDVICEELNDLRSIFSDHASCAYVLCGDFNTDIYSVGKNNCSDIIKQFMCDNSLACAYDCFPGKPLPTYVSGSGGESLLDYFMVSASIDVRSIYPYDCCFNFSDHLPLMCEFVYELDAASSDCVLSTVVESTIENQLAPVLRWDHADLRGYYEETRLAALSLFEEVSSIDDIQHQLESSALLSYVEKVLSDLVDILLAVGKRCIPCVRKGLYKHWWDEELRSLKSDSIASHQVWVDSGKPRSGPIWERRNKCRLLYRKAIREKRRDSELVYTNRLHDYLMNKDCNGFWRSWKAKFVSKVVNISVDGLCDDREIACHFGRYFEGIQNPPTNSRDSELLNEYVRMRAACDTSCNWHGVIDTGMLDRFVQDLKLGKSPGPDAISNEHIKFAHPVVVCILCKVFNWLLLLGKVPTSFTCSYTVPIPKVKGSGKTLCSCSDFRGIAISTVFSKLFEYSVLHIYRDLFATDCNQFGFKIGQGCSTPVFCARECIRKFITGGDSAYVLALDISKAFPRINHHSLLIKLVRMNFPVSFIDLIDDWLLRSQSRVRWKGYLSDTLDLRTGVNQGSVLAPFLFALCIDDLIVSSKELHFGTILVYADDILIIARTRHCLQRLFDNVLYHLSLLNLELNIDKSACLRFGVRCNCPCVAISLNNGESIRWVSELRYLGIFLTAGRKFACSAHNVKRNFNVACNAILARLLGKASEEVIVQLIRVKCLPVLLYGSEVCSYSKAILHSLDFCVVRFFMKIFATSNRDLILSILEWFNFPLPGIAIELRERNFLERVTVCHSLSSVALFSALCSSMLCIV
jgi:hypothetical protein